MSGDPAENLTRTDTGDAYEATSTDDIFIRPGSDHTTYTCYYRSVYDPFESPEFLRELDKWRREERLLAIQEKRSANRKASLKKKPTRPSAQLMGVCLNGRGWA
jgi:hypothetical protein